MTTHPKLLRGDAFGHLAWIADASVDAVVTDPPYAIDGGDESMLGQMTMPRKGRGNGHPLPSGPGTNSRGYADNDPLAFQAWTTRWARECLRVLKPGGHLVAFGGTRGWHRLASGIEDAGMDIRDSLAWIYGTGFPKGGESVTKRPGWATQLKPAIEPIVLARKPLAGTVAENLATYGTGALHLEPVRIEPGKWPGNVILDESQAEVMGEPSRFYYSAKAPASERVEIDGVKHPTVKPLGLTRWLINLVTPPGGIVLDPFVGSGTTLEAAYLDGFDSIGIELAPEFWPLIEARIARAVEARR